jgi:hypothetical protein
MLFSPNVVLIHFVVGVFLFYILEPKSSCGRNIRSGATSRKVAGSIPDGVIGIDIILSVALWPWSRLSL